jgi:hypothetical protein
LEEHQARGPNGSRPAEARKNQLGKERLDQKKKKSGKTNGRREEQCL